MLSKIALATTRSVSKLLNVAHLDRHIRNSNDVRLVFYHGIGDKSSPCMKFLNDEIIESTFLSQLDYLDKNYHFISLEDVVAYSKNNRTYSKPACSISFDDGLSTVYTKAFPILRDRNIPFSVFLNTSVIDNINLLWLHILGYLMSTYGVKDIAKSINALVDNDISRAPDDAKGIEDWCRANMEYIYENNLLSKLAESKSVNIKTIAKQQDMYLTWRQIEEMSLHGATFYSHTHQHFPLNSFANEAYIRKEIETARTVLSNHHPPCNLEYISFPFGMVVDYGTKAIDYALNLGHEYIVEVGDGLNSIKRINSEKIISRVGLGNVSADSSSLYCSLELWPVVKSFLKSL